MIASRGTWRLCFAVDFACFSWWLPPPRWLEQWWRIGMSWWLFVAIFGDCKGSCTFPGGVPKGNSSKLLVSLSYLTCGEVLTVSNHVDENCETPLSHRTTKCWSTQRRRSVLASTWTSGENRLSLVICILPVIGLNFNLWLVHPLHGGIITILTYLHSCKLVDTSSLV